MIRLRRYVDDTKLITNDILQNLDQLIYLYTETEIQNINDKISVDINNYLLALQKKTNILHENISLPDAKLASKTSCKFLMFG